MKINILCLVLLVAGLSMKAQALSDSWNVDASGNYTDTANWLGGNAPGVLNGTSSTDAAAFSYALTAGRTVTLGSVYAIGTLTFGNTSTNGYTLSGSTYRINNGGVIQTLAGTGSHNDTIASTINLRGTGNTAVTIRNDSVGNSAGLVISGDITSTVAAGKVYTINLDGVSTTAGIGTGARNNWISGDIVDAGLGDVAVVKNGSGLWTLTGANNFNALTFNAGTLRYFGGKTVFGLGTITVANSGVSFSHANSTAMTIANQMSVKADFSMVGSANTDWSGAWDLNAGTRTVTVSADSLVSGNITNGGLAKAGTKTLTLSGVNSYGGGTTVTDGTLLINGDNSGATGAVSVEAGAVLGGSGTIGGAVTVLADGTLSAGNSPGTLTFTDNLTLSAGSINIMEITDTAYDILMGDGANTLAVAGETVFDFTGFSGGVTNGYALALGSMFANWGSVDLSGATYSALGLAGGQSLDLTGGNMTVIPEPATLGLVIALGGGILGIRRIFMV